MGNDLAALWQLVADPRDVRRGKGLSVDHGQLDLIGIERGIRGYRAAPALLRGFRGRTPRRPGQFYSSFPLFPAIVLLVPKRIFTGNYRNIQEAL